MVLWVQYQLSVGVINSSVCKEIKRETTSKHFSLLLKVWKSPERMKVRILTTPLMQANTATAFKLATKSMSAQNIWSLLLSKQIEPPQEFSRLKNWVRIWWWSCLPLQQVTIPGGKWGPTGDLVWILGPTGDWSRRPTAAVRPVRGHTEQTPLLKYQHLAKVIT